MKPLIWKELQENARWAAMIVLLFGGYAVSYGRFCMCDSFFAFVSFVGALFGGGLGILQIMYESRGDRLAHLLHRPLSRSRIFLAKAFAGTGLYLTAMGIPFVLFVIRVSTTHLALPFRWETLLPWLADILTGLVYYFAGILAAERQGRWFGSRGLGFSVALLCSFLVWNVSQFWHAVFVILALGGLVAVAAWGVFLTGGDNEQRMPLFAKATLAITVLIGLMVLSVEGKVIAFESIVPRDARISGKSYLLNRAGRLLVLDRSANQVAKVTELDGREIDQFSRSNHDLNTRLYLLFAPAVSGGFPKEGSYRIFGRMYIEYEHKSIPRGERWFYVAEHGRLVGFDIVLNRLLGSIGPDGFSPGEPSKKVRFEGELYFRTNGRFVVPPDCVAFTSGVYAVDFGRREITSLFIPTAGETLLWAGPLQDNTQDSANVVAVTNRSVHIVSNSTGDVIALPLAYDRGDYELLTVYQVEKPQRWVVRYEPSFHQGLAARDTLPQHFVEYSATGQEISRTTVRPFAWHEPTNYQPWFGAVTAPAEAFLLLGTIRHEFIGTSSPSGAFGTNGVCGALCSFVLGSRMNDPGDLSPLAICLVDMLYGILPHPIDLCFGISNRRILNYAAGVLLNGMLGATCCLLLARQYAYSLRQCLIWTSAGFLFGPIGVLVMLAIQHWPARLPCPACGKLRQVTHEICESCGAHQAPPPLDGTEVFESGTDTVEPAFLTKY
ncbi:MAG: hypothetical protein JSS49_21145 [Planctomycetes bacterium]|nr:hypothetical protein [Planctomycetota bacterium]